jgi:lipopolysaccharide cholinephosphotransferase
VDIENIFPDLRETGETRIRQSQLVMLRMLKIFDCLCSKFGIKYFLIGGSLIGAVRHRGFIPWDDDLDIGMTRDNYEKFIKNVVPRLPKDIFYQSPETDKFYPACDYVENKLRDKYSSYNYEKYKYHDGIQLDIFVYDKAFLPHNIFIIFQNKLLKLLKSNKRRSKVLKSISKLPFPFVYSNSWMCFFKGIFLGSYYIKQNELSTLSKVQFEDMETYIPIGWDKILRRQFGDYMKLPSKEKQITHHTDLPNAFTPCNHTETLKWSNRSSVNKL